MKLSLTAVSLVSMACALVVHAAEMRGISVGVRGGSSLNSRTDDFRQVVATADFDLPWKFSLGSDFKLHSRADFSAGWLGGENEHSVIGTIGPSALLSWRDCPVTLEGGSSPTLISRYHFAGRDFGGSFQFTTHIGLNWDVSQHVRLGYRYQHMSNAGISQPNPGLNLHMVGVSYRF